MIELADERKILQDWSLGKSSPSCINKYLVDQFLGLWQEHVLDLY